ncbi:hypothetical protein BaRGS_00032617 [Batillaria attramentaria]|uniref:C-type lectin domain-containing protein n=1 Tax=Batillaria attramentaria TaxID=370345 RepID=A0ABD0JMR5_9CAEN
MDRPVKSLGKGVIFFIILTAINSLTIPDKLQYDSTLRLVYYSSKGNFYQADRLCRHNGGFLVLVDSPEMVETMQTLEAKLGGMTDVFTRMIRHDDQGLYSYDDTCQPVDTTKWSNWESSGDSVYDASQQCFRARNSIFTWQKLDCSNDNEFVCEYKDPCNFHMSSNITLAALPAQNASMQLCQDMCDQMIGCFATAPSGVSTLPPYTMCLFIVVNDTTNPMSSRHCRNKYEMDDITDPKTDIPFSGTDPVEPKDPDDCVPTKVNTIDPHEENNEQETVSYWGPNKVMPKEEGSRKKSKA